MASKSGCFPPISPNRRVFGFPLVTESVPIRLPCCEDDYESKTTFQIRTKTMNRVTFCIALIVVSNVSGLALAGNCRGGGGGGYRSHAPRYHAPAYRPQPAYRQPVYRQPVQHAPIQQPIVQQPTTRPISIAPRTNAPRTASPRVAQPTTPAQPNTQNNNQNNGGGALAFLAGGSSNQAATPQTSQSHVGTWSASTSNGASITLNLNSNGAFSWVAKVNGKTTRFDGNYTLENGTLTLARSSDNQKLSGSIAFGGSGFNFKLDGAKDNGLNFQQS